ncbi:MAG: heavy metal-associated domain-containing protein [Clostridia bacterium]|nr:heavy metal-associated domain-containing protein [Clostridia bacterium]
MKRVFKLEALDCAHCAARVEAAISRIEGVDAASVNFLSQKLTLEAGDAIFDEVLQKAVKAARRIEPDMRILS